MADTQLLYESTYLTNLVTRRCEWSKDDGTQKQRAKQQPLADVLPEEVMSAIEPYIGDGAGRVSIGAELSQSKDFQGAKAFVNISVSCNNDIDSCVAVHDIVQPIVRQLVNQDVQMMAEDRDAYHAQAPAQAAPEPGRVSPGPPAGSRPPVSPRPPATSATPPKTITPTRPSFRR